MKKNKTKLLVILGAICILLVAVSSWYTITFNEARFIVPMDISTYTFRLKDLPMIISGILITFYVLYLVVLLIQVIAVNKRKGNNATITRNLNPKLGFLGFLGFFGFLGFWTYNIDKTIFPFVFFVFFGFFGFFYEGKLSNTFMDERYQENKMLFMVIIILVRPIMSYNEIVSVLESSVALLAGVFMADIYYMEYMNERISTYSLFPIKQKRGSILKRAFISQLYLIVLVAVFYWGFVLVYHPTNYSGVPVISLYASCVGACAASMFFMGTFCFTATNLMRNLCNCHIFASALLMSSMSCAYTVPVLLIRRAI